MSRFRWPVVASAALSGLVTVDAVAPVTALSTTTAPIATTATTAVSAARPAGTPLPKGDITSALLQARLERKRVEVTDGRTETRTS
jgi:hypothetical protein